MTTVRVRFVRLGKLANVEATTVLREAETTAEAVARLAHKTARGELKGVDLKVRVTVPEGPNAPEAYAYIEADVINRGKISRTRVGHGPVWVSQKE